MAEAVFTLCAAASTLCAALLLRNWWRTRSRLLLWSSLCFVGLALNNILLVVDRVLVPDIDLGLLRTSTALVALLLLLYGLIWEAR
jgi:hypothetical protein